MSELAPEDAKLLVLARATRGRTRAAQAVAMRDTDGRTYASAPVALPSLEVSATAGCLAMAVSGGATGLEAVLVLGGALTEADRAAIADYAGPQVVVHEIA